MFHTSGYSHYPWLTNGGQVTSTNATPSRTGSNCRRRPACSFKCS